MSNADIAPPYKDQINSIGPDDKFAVEHIDKTAQYKDEAVDAENKEQAMTVMEAVKAYPSACAWAFTMSSTIVSTSDVMWGIRLYRCSCSLFLDHGILLPLPYGFFRRPSSVQEEVRYS
jgi:hypothetical protein